jgi:transposase-like protein
VDASVVDRALARPAFVRPAVAGSAGPVSLAPRLAPGGAAADPTSAERAAIEAALAATGGNVRRAARRLGVPRSTLRYRIGRFGLEHLLPRGRASHDGVRPCRLVGPGDGAAGPSEARSETAAEAWSETEEAG